MPKLDSLKRLFENELKDVYDAEKRLTKALPKMAKAAQSDELREALRNHLEETANQVKRLELVFEAAGLKAASKPCAGMKGLLEEGQEAMDADGPETLTDLAIIQAARRVEHYEIAAYEGLLSLAGKVLDGSATHLIQANLAEERQADQTLASIGENLLANSDAMEEEEEPVVSRVQPKRKRAGS
jgi:ferritin-like metal-binding protein YciE